MKIALAVWFGLLLAGRVCAEPVGDERQVRDVVQAFYASFNSHGWSRAAEFTTEDWNHINPGGGWTRGRAAVLLELEAVHQTFLKGVSDTVEEMTVRFASPDVAIVTVTSRVSPFMTPDGVVHRNEQHLRTFVLVRREQRWLIMQDQNTVVVPRKP